MEIETAKYLVSALIFMKWLDSFNLPPKAPYRKLCHLGQQSMYYDI